MIQITERDKRFLLLLNETGACNAKFPLTIYPKRYCRDRLEQMEKEKIIIRKYNLIILGVEGKLYLESTGIVPNIVATKPIDSQRRLARSLELRYLLPSMEVVSSAQFKKENNLNRGMQFVAAATTKTGPTYLIYDVPKILRTESKTQILRELKNKKSVINNAIIFTRNKDFIQMLCTGNIYVTELLLLPPNVVSIAMLNVMGEGNFDRKVLGAAFPELKESNIFDKKQSQYIVKNNCYINLALNNISALDMLSSLDVQAIQNNYGLNSIYNVVCLEFQRAFLQYTIDGLNLKKLNVQLKTIAPGQSSFY